jgi:hypothetical protein
MSAIGFASVIQPRLFSPTIGVEVAIDHHALTFNNHEQRTLA